MSQFTENAENLGNDWEKHRPTRNFKLVFLTLLLSALCVASATTYILILNKNKINSQKSEQVLIQEDTTNPFQTTDNPFENDLTDSSEINPFDDQASENPFDIFQANSSAQNNTYQNPFE